MADLKPADLIDPGSFFRMGVSPQMIEILPQISGVKFDDAWQRRIEAVIDEQTGLKAFVISAEDFITNKLAAARLQDLADVEGRSKSSREPAPEAQKKRPWLVNREGGVSNRDHFVPGLLGFTQPSFRCLSQLSLMLFLTHPPFMVSIRIFVK